MAKRYRVIHERRGTWEAIFSGGRDRYLAQARLWWGWHTLHVCNSQLDAEAACRDHAGGTLLRGGARIVAEFEKPEP